MSNGSATPENVPIMPMSSMDKALWPLLKVFYRLGITPNMVTVARLLLVPGVCWLILQQYAWSDVLAALLFIITAFTDCIDGGLARTTGQITLVGRWLDPLVDKLLTFGTLIAICLVGDQWASEMAWMVGIIVVFEGSLIVFRPLLKLAIADLDLSAQRWGKIKMTLQCALMIVLILPLPVDGVVDLLLMAAIVGITIESNVASVDYFLREYVKARRSVKN